MALWKKKFWPDIKTRCLINVLHDKTQDNALSSETMSSD